MRSALAGLALVLLLTGCGQEFSDKNAVTATPEEASGGAVGFAGEMDASGRAAPPPAPPPPPADAPQSSPAPQQPGPGQAPLSGPSPVLYLAYAYQMGLQLPADRLTGVMDSHVRACQEAGPRVCQLVGANRSGDPESYISGFVSLRGEPAWLRGFMGNVASQADEAGGRVQSQTTSTEDLTRAIVDTEARLRAMRALRDRLQRLLESRPGRLADLLEVERELARVQGEIDATESNLAVMRTRVAMSELTLNYESATRPVGSDTFEPLAEALANFLRWVVIGFAAIITIIAALLPFALVGGLLLWAALAWRRRNGGRFWGRREPAPPSDPPPAANA